MDKAAHSKQHLHPNHDDDDDDFAHSEIALGFTYIYHGIIFFFLAELIDFKTRRVAAFRKNLVELAELELKHAKVVL